MPIVILLLGIIVVGLGILSSKFNGLSSEPEVEILGESLASSNNPFDSAQGKSSNSSNLTVEAAGEIIKPGVYQLPFGSRINDLLIAAGGFSVNADREWVAKNVNLAQKLVDGGKVFVPKKFEISNLKFKIESSENNVTIMEKVNINSATANDLDQLSGIGPATCQKIISSRPYQKIEELLERKIVSNKVWEEIKDKVVVY